MKFTLVTLLFSPVACDSICKFQIKEKLVPTTSSKGINSKKSHQSISEKYNDELTRDPQLTLSQEGQYDSSTGSKVTLIPGKGVCVCMCGGRGGPEVRGNGKSQPFIKSGETNLSPAPLSQSQPIHLKHMGHVSSSKTLSKTVVSLFMSWIDGSTFLQKASLLKFAHSLDLVFLSSSCLKGNPCGPAGP